MQRPARRRNPEIFARENPKSWVGVSSSRFDSKVLVVSGGNRPPLSHVVAKTKSTIHMKESLVVRTDSG